MLLSRSHLVSRFLPYPFYGNRGVYLFFDFFLFLVIVTNLFKTLDKITNLIYKYIEYIT